MKFLIDQIQILELCSRLNVKPSHFLFALPIFLMLIVAKILFLYVITVQRKKAANSISLLFFSIPIVIYILGEFMWFLFLFGGGDIIKTILRIVWQMQPLHFYAQVLFLRSVVVQKYDLRRSEQIILQLLALFVFFPLLAVESQ